MMGKRDVCSIQLKSTQGASTEINQSLQTNVHLGRGDRPLSPELCHAVIINKSAALLICC